MLVLIFEKHKQKKSNESARFFGPLVLRFSKRFPTKRIFTPKNILTPPSSALKTLSKRLSYLLTQSAFTCSKLTIETPQQGVKYVQS